MKGWVAVLLACAATAQAQQIEAGKTQFAARCAGCHGLDATGGEIGPNLVDAGDDTLFSAPLAQIITHGITDAGMPSFTLPKPDLDALVAYLTSLRATAAAHPPAGDVSAGQQYFFGAGRCTTCHMVDGQGGVLGPDLSNLGHQRRVERIAEALRHPVPRTGYAPVTVQLRDGRAVRGVAKNESNFDLQLLDLTGTLHFLSRAEIAHESHDSVSLMPPVVAGGDTVRDLVAYLSRLTAHATPQHDPPERPETPAIGDWPTYNGNPSGNRYSPLRAIDTSNVHTLAPAWMFPFPKARHLEGTPIVVGGMMFVTTANEAYALDAATGRAIWHYARPLTKGVIGDAAGAINRGVAVRGDRVFMVTDHAHLVALSRTTGAPLWDVAMADYHQHYGATGAPLVIDSLVLSGTSGGDEGDRGFISAYDTRTGRRVWRFWTIPKPGEPLASTWRGRALEHGCGAAWLTGTYDPSTNLVYWPTGNPCPDYNGDERQGDNLYSSSVLALEPHTGKLAWYYQFTPHNLHDWDATQTPALINTVFQGQPRKLLVQANRNGFFYVLDRITGKVLLSRPFVHKLTWASAIGPDGRPLVLPERIRRSRARRPARHWRGRRTGCRRRSTRRPASIT